MTGNLCNCLRRSSLFYSNNPSKKTQVSDTCTAVGRISMYQSYSPKRFFYAVLTFVVGSMITPAWGQATPDESASELVLEEIIVTAQMRRQSLIDVPISVAVVSGGCFT